MNIKIYLILILAVLISPAKAQQAADTTSRHTYSAYELISSYYEDNFHPFKAGNGYVGLTFSVRDRKQVNNPGLLQNTIEGDDLSYRVQLRGGYFIGDYVMTGVSVIYHQSKFTGTIFRDPDTLNVRSINRGYEIAPMLRTYFPLTRTERLSFFLEIGFGFGQNNGLRRETKNLDEISKVFTDEFMFAINISPGINFFAMQNFSFEIQLNVAGYQLTVTETTTNGTDKSRDVRNNVNFNLDLLSLNLGLAYFINNP